MILAVDTSLSMFSVALLSGEKLLGGVMMEGKESRNEKLLPAIDWLFGETARALRDVELLVVTRGPGSFTGVRVGLATVQGLAFSVGRPVCAISTHEAAALGELNQDRIVAWGNAGRGEYYLSRFEAGREIQAPVLVGADELRDLERDATRSIDVDRLAAGQNLARLAGLRALQIRDAGSLERYAEVTPLYVRLAEADVKLRQKLPKGI